MATNKSSVKAYVTPFKAKMIKAEAAYGDTSESKIVAAIIDKHYSGMTKAEKDDLLRALD